MLIELDAFSGKPNPRWFLDGEDAASLLRLHGALSVAEHAPEEPPGLGYRGFLYHAPAETFRVLKGYVVAPGPRLADPSLSIERFLLDRLPPEIQGMRAKVLAELLAGQ